MPARFQTDVEVREREKETEHHTHRERAERELRRAVTAVDARVPRAFVHLEHGFGRRLERTTLVDLRLRARRALNQAHAACYSASEMRLCVFCGSKSGSRPEFAEAARALGKELASRRIGLVYGGASVGVMGAIANAVLELEGEVIGVIPHGVFDREVAHTALTELHVVKTMHERKALMADKADAFLALPGGLGTFDELFEMLTWKQIGLHDKPIGLLDVAGYFSETLRLIQRARRDGFLDGAPLAITDTNIDLVLRTLLPHAKHPQIPSTN